MPRGDLLYVDTTPALIFRDVTDFNPTSGVALLGDDDTAMVQLDLTGLGIGAYRQSAKFDFGKRWAEQWVMMASIEPVSAPTAAGTVAFYIGYSNRATAGVNNVANLSGADAAYTGYGATAATATSIISQLTSIGTMTFGNQADVNVAMVGVPFTPLMRYGSLVVFNNLSVALAADAVEMSVQLFPMHEQRVD
jgi:hypothetical protein